MVRPSAMRTPVTLPSSSDSYLGGEDAAVDFEALGLDQAAERLAGAFIQLGVHEPGRAVDDDRSGAELLGAGSGLEAQQATADGDGVDLAAELFGAVRRWPC